MDQLDNMLREEVSPQQLNRERLTRDAWIQMMKSRNGRRVVWDLLSISHFGMSAFAGDRDATTFIAGKQKVAEYIFQNVTPENFLLMSTEAKEDLNYDRPDENGND